MKENTKEPPVRVAAAVTCHYNGQEQGEALVAEEVPVAVSYDGTTHAVMMATPADLEDFAIGFSLTEGIIRHISEVEAITVIDVPGGLDVQLALTPAQRDAFRTRRRHMAGPVGCGLCGVESIAAAIRPLPVFNGHFTLGAADITAGIAALCHEQPLNDATRGAHAAGFYDVEEGLILSREDIGRHNALDKLIGAAMRENRNLRHGMVAITSRLSVEMVQKAAVAGVPVVAAISAPTSEAIRAASRANITLAARVRGESFEVFTHPEKIVLPDTVR